MANYIECPKCKNVWLYGPHDTTNKAVIEEATAKGITFPVKGNLMFCGNGHWFVIKDNPFNKKLFHADHYLFGRT